MAQLAEDDPVNQRVGLASDCERCLQAGMEHVITKPASSGQLAGIIECWTGHRTLSPTQW